MSDDAWGDLNRYTRRKLQRKGYASAAAAAAESDEELLATARIGQRGLAELREALRKLTAPRNGDA
jgi:hypothetical protein